MIHEKYMRRCLELAKNGLPLAMPNPAVGAVLVYNNTIIGEGFTSPFGGNHAEVNCINSVFDSNSQLISKSTLYVSLEPCSHFGKTPPCANLIVEHTIPKVVIGCIDTFSQVAGKGIEKLKNAGIEVIDGVLEMECRALNKRFFTFHEKKRPYIVLKWARTKDNFIAPTPDKHEEERWITGDKVQQLVHKLRTEEMAILVGTNTVIADNPALTARKYKGKNSTRIVLDRTLKLWNYKEKYVVFNSDSRTIIFNEKENFELDNCLGIKVNFNSSLLSNLLDELYRLSIQSVIIEGGSKTLQSFIDADLWDEALVYEGNKIFNNGVSEPTMQDNLVSEIAIGKDRLSHYINSRTK